MTFARVFGLGTVMALAVTAMPSVSFGQVSARKALDAPIKQLTVDGVSLEKTLKYLRDVSGANFVINWKVLEQAGVTKDIIITLDVKDLSLRKMMRLVLDQASPNAQLVFDASENVITVTTQEEADKHLVTKVYTVDDLLIQATNKQPPPMGLGVVNVNDGNGGVGMGGRAFDRPAESGHNGAEIGDSARKQKSGDELAALIRDAIRPNIWKENGGTASVRYAMGKLIVTAPISVQEAIGGPVEGGIRYGN